MKGVGKFYLDSFVASYSQMFFSSNQIFAYLILISTFINPASGISGVAAVLLAISYAYWLGFNEAFIRTGSYSFNALMVGLLMGLYFKVGIPFLILLCVFTFLSVIVTKALYIVFSKYDIPVLGLPFIVSIWVLLLCARSFHTLQFDESNLYMYNNLFAIGGAKLVNAYDQIKFFDIPQLVEAYFKSLGAIYFQYNIVAGIIIAIGLLIYSRIAFTLSIIGFAVGYYFVYFMSGSVSELTYSYIGFNYILAAISLGGFYLIPSRNSYLLALAATVVIAVMHIALGNVVQMFQLPLYSLPCSIIIIMVLLTLKHRPWDKNLELVRFQLFSPEKNLYAHTHRVERFKNETYFQVHLPFYGEWYISQGHDGGITHLGDWKYAWDFVVADDMKKTFRLPGTELADFYCYNVPVLAPASGYVWQVVDEVDDNLVGDVDVQQNWGNTIIIKHGEGLFSKLSHLKKESFRVKMGDYVHRGDWVANCGNSGRSPEPHIHFQMQTTPFVGSKSLRYPISYYVTREGNKYDFHSFDYPREQASVMGIHATPILHKAFSFIPGAKLCFEVSEGKGERYLAKWEAFTDAYNNSYLYCSKTNSYAYYVNNGTLHYFTDFYGDRKSLLYYFFLGCHKVLLGYFQDMEVPDLLPVQGFYSGPRMLLQDFVAPFNIYLKANYSATFKQIDDINFPNRISIMSSSKVMDGKKEIKHIDCEIVIQGGMISSLKITDGIQQIVATCIAGD